MQRDIKEIADLAIKYTSQDLGKMVQQGLLDPTKAMMAGMMRKRIAADEMKPPETTVMQDVFGEQEQPQMGQQPEMQPENPQQMADSGGMASLDAGDTGNYAGGGIIAFDDGGYVPGYAGNDGSAVKDESSSMLGRGTKRLLNYLTEVDPETEAKYAAGKERQRILDRAAEISVGPLTQETEAQRAAREAEEAQLSKQLLAVKPVTMGMTDVKKGRAASAGLDKLLATIPVSQEAAAEEGAAEFIKVPQDKKFSKAKSGMGFDLPAIDSGQGGVRPAPIIRGGANLPAIDPNIGKITPEPFVKPEKVDYQTALQQEKEDKASVGFDEGMYSKLRETLSEKKDKLSQRKDEAAGFALMQASLGLMGARRGQEFQTLSAEAKNALSGYVNSVKDIRDNESKLEDKISDLNVAENQYRLTKSQAARARVDSREKEIRDIETKTIEARNKAAADQAAIEAHLFGYRTDAEVKRYVADKNYAAHIISAANANRPSEGERDMARYKAIYEKQGPEAANAFVELKGRLLGAGKPEGILSDAEIMKIVVPTLLPGKNSPAEIARAVKEYKEAAGLISGGVAKPTGVADPDKVKSLLGK